MWALSGPIFGVLAACQKGISVGFITASALFHELLEARDEKRLLRLQRQLAAYKLPIIDELGYVPSSTAGAGLLFEVFSQRYERGSTSVTINLPFEADPLVLVRPGWQDAAARLLGRPRAGCRFARPDNPQV